jgi:integrase
MKVRLTQEVVDGFTLPKGKNDGFIWDMELENFGVRARRGVDGVRKTYVVQYRAHGRTRRHTLPLARFALPKAREAARRILAKVTLGHDPQAEKRAKRLWASRTFAAAVALYLADKTGRPGTLRASKLYLTGPYFKPLHATGISEIKRADLAEQLTAIAHDHSAITAHNARQAASALFAWAVAEGWIEHNPMIGLRKTSRPASRSRVLSHTELAAIWHACADDDYGRIVRLLILLGSRRQEIGGMRWDELNPDTGVWTLPASRSKNGRPHTVTLPPLARAIIAGIPGNDGDFLFGKRGVGFMAWSAPKRALDQRLGVAPWRLHDLRRTVATLMADDLHVEPHLIEAVLNHYDGHRRGVAGIYNRATYECGIRITLERWQQHVLALAEGRRQLVPADSTGLLLKFPASA